MKRYKLSNKIRITGFDNYDPAEIPDQYKDGYSILESDMTGKEYMINASIRYYLDKFSTAKSPDQVLEEIESEMNQKSEVLKAACDNFFQFLSTNNVLIPEDRIESTPTVSHTYEEGDKINEFKVSNHLSSNDSLDVYLVVDLNTSIEYVVKLLNKSKTTTEKSFVSRFKSLKAEYDLQESLNHVPCICKVYKFENDQEGNPFLVMEYIKGYPLSDFIRQSTNLGLSSVLFIIKNILDGFALLHENKLLHGDIHAANIIVKDDYTISIIDLGMSHWITPENNEVIKFGGVDGYMPPERINITSLKKHAKAPDFTSEVYQLGLIMFKILYNTLPFNGFVWEELAVKIKEGQIEYPETGFRNFKVPAELISIIKKCLNIDPNARYKNAQGILEDFRFRVISDERVLN